MGEVRDYFGMELYYIKQVTVKLSMIKYLDSVIQYFSNHLGTNAATLKADHLFEVCNEGKKQYLPEDESNTFHHAVAKLILM